MPNNNLTKADIQKENFKMALGVFLRTILSAVLCFFVYMSLSVLFNGFFTHDIGYQIYETTSDGSVALIEEHYYADDSSAPSSTPQAAGPGTPANPGQEEKTNPPPRPRWARGSASRPSVPPCPWARKSR